MSSESIINAPADWWRKASEDDLRNIVAHLDMLDEESDEYHKIKLLLDAEANRRSRAYYENINTGEWI